MKHTFPVGKYNLSQMTVDKIEDLCNDLIKKDKNYLLFNFNPDIADEDGKYYPYACAFDSEAMSKKIETKGNERNYQSYLSMCWLVFLYLVMFQSMIKNLFLPVIPIQENQLKKLFKLFFKYTKSQKSINENKYIQIIKFGCLCK